MQRNEGLEMDRRHRMLRRGVGILLLAGVVAGASLFAQDAPTVPPLPPQSDVIAALEQRVQQLELIVLEQHDELDRLGRLCAGVETGAWRLAVAADLAEQKGFVEAGANPDAKTELLTGLRDFHETMRLAAEPPKPPEESKRRGR